MKTYTEQEVRAIVLAFASKLDEDYIGKVFFADESKTYLDNHFKPEAVTPSLLTKEEIDAHVEINSRATQGVVVFFNPNHQNGTIEEYARTSSLSIQEAFDVYANTPNPASQLIQFSTEAEHQSQAAFLAKCIQDREWLDELFNQI